METQHNALLNMGVERGFGDSPWSLFGKVFLEYDEFKAFDLRAALNGGVGYKSRVSTLSFDGNGSPDFVYLYTFDADGNNTRFDHDRDGDGTIDQVRTYIYDSDGNQVEQRYDGNADGITDRHYYYVFNTDGYRIAYESDTNADGMIDNVSRYMDWQPSSIAAYF